MNKELLDKVTRKGAHALSQEERTTLLEEGLIKKCTCGCHDKDGPVIMHFAPCCDNGYLIANMHFFLAGLNKKLTKV